MTTDERILPGSGRTVQLQMPDLYGALSAGTIPNPLLAPIIGFLDSARPNDMTQALIKSRDNIMALYHLASLCLVEPKLILKGEPGPGDIGTRDLRFDDLLWIYWSYFRSDDTTIATNIRAHLDLSPSGGPVPPEPDAALSPVGDAGDH